MPWQFNCQYDRCDLHKVLNYVLKTTFDQHMQLQVKRSPLRKPVEKPSGSDLCSSALPGISYKHNEGKPIRHCRYLLIWLVEKNNWLLGWYSLKSQFRDVEGENNPPSVLNLLNKSGSMISVWCIFFCRLRGSLDYSPDLFLLCLPL